MSVIEISESQSFPSVLNVKRGPELRRYVPERTCRNELSGYTDCMGRPVPDQFRCSECGEHSPMVDVGFGDMASEAPKFCPRCGARVVSE